MPQIPTMGFSAFLKLISLSDKRQKSTIRERHKPSKDSKPYDRHRSLRRAIQKLATGTQTPAEVFAATSLIKNKGERRSTRLGIIRFLKWRKANPGQINFCDAIVIQSPGGFFRIRFEANCVMEMGGRRTAIHIWNTKEPKLQKSIVIAALTLVQRNWPKESDLVDDFAILDLRNMQLHRWSENPKAYSTIVDAIMQYLDLQCKLSRNEFGLPTIGPQPKGPQLET
ncbi:hypothetical protein [Rhizobium sp. NRK18]|uniref:hypothetical protein n=1 Tax=Rhizobium sp. NRK18 TaxID=2964667 RepID=UPI0021C4A615|nr:hypothetical protein [Rhizobium sp. NRK18]MCQ2003998.1 hypothetical protein [Rhizobium sp. NRK18]